MPFEDNIIFLILKFLTTFTGTIGMMISTIDFKLIKGKFLSIVFTLASHILISLYIAVTVTLLNTALHGTKLSDIFLCLLFYLLIILFDFHFIRPVYLDLITTIKKRWRTLSLISCAFIIFAVTITFYPEHYTKRTYCLLSVHTVSQTVFLLFGNLPITAKTLFLMLHFPVIWELQKNPAF